MLSHFTRTICVVTLLLGLNVATPRPAGAQEPATARKVTTRVAPVYPQVAKNVGLVGTVKLELVVGPEGSVKSLKTIGGNALLVVAAESAVKRWKFEPAKAETTELIAVRFDSIVR